MGWNVDHLLFTPISPDQALGLHCRGVGRRVDTPMRTEISRFEVELQVEMGAILYI